MKASATAGAPVVARDRNAAREETPFRRFLGIFFEVHVAKAASGVLALVLFVAVAAPWLSPQNPYDLAFVDVMDARMPPGGTSWTGEITFPLGSDGAGRDMLSAIACGLRISLGVGVMSGVIALLIGMCVGLLAAYHGGRVDTVVMRVVDLQLSFPAILVALILVAVLGKGVDKVVIALVLVQWAYYARTVRGGALVERRKEYIEAATCLALSHRRIVFRHLLPNCLPPMIVLFMELRSQLDLAYLFISHDLGVVEHLSDRVVIMHLGRIVESADTDRIFGEPSHPYTRALLQEVPRLEARKTACRPIEGEIPSPLDPPDGCHFHPRCPHASARCRQEAPALREIAPGWHSACHLNEG